MRHTAECGRLDSKSEHGQSLHRAGRQSIADFRQGARASARNAAPDDRNAYSCQEIVEDKRYWGDSEIPGASSPRAPSFDAPGMDERSITDIHNGGDRWHRVNELDLNYDHVTRGGYLLRDAGHELNPQELLERRSPAIEQAHILANYLESVKICGSSANEAYRHRPSGGGMHHTSSALDQRERLKAPKRISNPTEESSSVQPYTMPPDTGLLRTFFVTDPRTESLHGGFQVRKNPRKFFQVGRVFMILWAEPCGSGSSSSTSSMYTFPGKYGEYTFSKVRRFVVIRQGLDHCSALPIVTNQGRGAAIPAGLDQSEYGIIYTGKLAPQPSPEESLRSALQPIAIRVLMDSPADKLSPMSRINYGKVYTVEHNLKVGCQGKVHTASMPHFVEQFQSVWLKPFFNAPDRHLLNSDKSHTAPSSSSSRNGKIPRHQASRVKLSSPSAAQQTHAAPQATD